MKKKLLIGFGSVVALGIAFLLVFFVMNNNKKVNIKFIVDDTEYQVVEYKKGEVQIPYEPIKDGYIFDGWYFDSSFTEEFKSDSLIDKKPKEDIKIYGKWEYVNYLATFKNDEGVVGTKVFNVETTSLTEPKVPEKVGYTGSWESYKLGSKSITIMAVYTPIDYTISYTNTKGSNNGNPLTYNILSDDIVLENITSNDYEFVGWYNGNNLALSIPSGSTGDITLRAMWSMEDYAINYTNTKNIVHNNPTIYNVETETIALNDLEDKDGYEFVGWYNGNDLVAEIPGSLRGDLTLEARWEAIEFTATFKADGNVVETKTFTVETSNLSNIPAVPNKVGYSGVWESYTLELEDIEINANYTIKTYTISYTNTKGATNSNPISYNVETSTITLTNLSKDGYEFDGWYNGNDEVISIPKGSTGNITLDARWEEIEFTATFKADDNVVETKTFTVETSNLSNIPAVPNKVGYSGVWESYILGLEDIEINANYTIKTYTISYTNTKGVSHSNPVSYNVETNMITLTNLSKDGYEFVGWYNGNTKVTTIPKGSTGNITLDAKWTTKEFTATFKADGHAVETKTFTVETSNLTNIPAVPNKVGYSGVWENYTLGLEDIEINANYTIKTYTISYTNTKGVSHGNPESYNVETNTITLTNLSKDGYEFDGWYNGNTKVTTIPKGSTGNITLDARWTTKEFTATFKADGNVVETKTFTVETSNLTNIPAVPNKVGYSGVWESYTLGLEDIEINANYTIKTYTINYTNTKGVSHGNPESYNVETSTITLANLSKDGYEFDGWYNGNDEVISIPKGSTGNITLDARWTTIEFTATFKADGNVVETKTFTVETGDLTNIPAVPNKVGYSGVWESYTLGLEDIEINANYTIKTYIINYTNTKDATNNNPTSYNIETETITLANLNKDGYEFDGWYNGNTKVISIPKGSTGNITLDARWTEASDNLYTMDGDYIYFGEYPQTKVWDETIITSLTALQGTLPTSTNSQTWTSYGYYQGTGSSGSATNTTNYMWYKDVAYNDEQYRGVYFTSYRPYVTYYPSSTSDSNQDDEGYTTSNVYWFKFEPIKWRILKETNNEALLLCEMIIDSQDFYPHTESRTIEGKTIYANNWEYSTIRSWLNDNFYNTAFNALQKELIITQTLDNKTTAYKGSSNTYATCQNNTEDNIYLLSYQDVLNANYGFSISDSYDEVREKKATDYAEAQGADNSTSSGYLENGYWRLRSPSNDYSISASYVSDDGIVNGNNFVIITNSGVAPALTIRLS